VTVKVFSPVVPFLHVITAPVVVLAAVKVTLVVAQVSTAGVAIVRFGLSTLCVTTTLVSVTQPLVDVAVA
jgi:hypothetical protein